MSARSSEDSEATEAVRRRVAQQASPWRFPGASEMAEAEEKHRRRGVRLIEKRHMILQVTKSQNDMMKNVQAEHRAKLVVKAIVCTNRKGFCFWERSWPAKVLHGGCRQWESRASAAS